MNTIMYRPDIDGMRAIAVLAVVLFHAGFQGVGGGYVGVDIFFVISGFLITSIVHKEVCQGNFSLLRFYERRIRRILPAFIVMLVATLVAAYLFLLPKDLVFFSKSLVAAVVSLSNVFFWRNSGYFDGSGDFAPLLHTWSLSVEEQFYVFFPLMLLFVQKWMKERYVLWVLVVTIVSFFISIWTVYLNQSTAFYLLHTRAWELALGALLALGLFPALHKRAWREAEGILGFSLMGGSIVLLSSDSTFPGLNALFPCLGAALVIHSGSRGNTIVGKILSWKPLVLIGLVSYSFYLWHWPVFVFTKYYLLRSLTDVEAVGLVTVSFLLALLSWRYIERPFRKRRERVAAKQVFLGAVAVTGVLVGVGFSGLLLQGIPSRMPIDVAELALAESDFSKDSRACMEGNRDRTEGAPLCSIGDEEAEPSFIVLGDSHAGALMPGISLAAKEYGQAGWHAAAHSCPPFLGVLNRKGEEAQSCTNFRNEMLDFIALTPSITKVVLSARWAAYAEGSRFGEDDFGPKPRLYDEFGQGEGNKKVFVIGLKRLLHKLQEMNKETFLIASVPEVGRNVPSVLARTLWFEQGSGIELKRQVFDERNQFVLKTMEELQDEYGVKIILPHTALCSLDFCATIKDGIPLYYDDDHMSVFGAKSIRGIYDDIFE